jgi:hypothetical protein
MGKIKVILPAIIAGVLAVAAGCSQHVAEGDERKGPAARGVESARGRATEEVTPGNGRFGDGVSDTAAQSSLTRLEGKLLSEDPEWFIDTGNEVVALHLGNRAYLESLEESLHIELEEGGHAVVFGIMEEDGLSVVRMTTAGGELALRSDSGIPLWAGNGNRAQDRLSDTAETEKDVARGGGRGLGRGAGENSGQGTGRGSGGGARSSQQRGDNPKAL